LIPYFLLSPFLSHCALTVFVKAQQKFGSKYLAISFPFTSFFSFHHISYSDSFHPIFSWEIADQ
jgi:hypothetical protein